MTIDTNESGRIRLFFKMHVIIDYREKSSGLQDLLAAHFTIALKKIPYGDYLINNRITVERKTARDFLISIIDLRLFKQAASLKKYCSNPLLLIEGNPYATGLGFDPKAIKGAILSLQSCWQIPIIFSHSKEDSVEILAMIGRQDEVVTNVVHMRGGYRPKKLKSRQLYLLQGLPDIGPKLANSLLDHFKSAFLVMSATIEELMEVEGVGQTRASRIREVLDSENMASG